MRTRQDPSAVLQRPRVRTGNHWREGAGPISWFWFGGVLKQAMPLTSLAARQVAAPRQVPLAHEQLGPDHLVPWVALVGHHGALNQLRVGCALPPIGDLWKLRAGVIPRNLCRNEEKRNPRVETVQVPPRTSMSGFANWPEFLGADLLVSGSRVYPRVLTTRLSSVCFPIMEKSRFRAFPPLCRSVFSSFPSPLTSSTLI